MELILTRRYLGPTYTIGTLEMVDETGIIHKLSDTLEDQDRGTKDTDSIHWIMEHKVHSKSAIPTGRYEVAMNYSNRFKRQMPILLNVKGFEGIRIHNGRTEEHTSGCILVGRNTIKGQLTESIKYFRFIYALIHKVLAEEKIFITIKYK